MPNPLKIKALEKIVNEIKGKSVLFINFRGLKTLEIEGIKNELREKGGVMKVVKNSLIQKMVEKNPETYGSPLKEQILDILKDPTAIVYGEDDIPGICKVIKTHSENSPMEIKGMIFDKFLTTEEILKLAEIPSREVLLGRLAALFMSPLNRLVRALNWPLVSFVGTLGSIMKKKGGDAA